MTKIDGVAEDSGVLQRPYGPDLCWQSFVPEDREPTPGPRPTLVFIHGLAEHFGRYTFPVTFFTGRGYPCYGVDLRGHGLSGGGRAHVNRFGEYLIDVDAIMDLARDRHPGNPIILIGHSMGGLIAALYAMTHANRLTGLMVSSPVLQAHPDSAPSSFLLFLGRIASIITPRLHFPTGLDPSLVSRNPEVVEDYRNDPLVTNKVSARWATELLAAQDRCFHQASQLTLPNLIMQSGADRLVNPSATRCWAKLVPQETSHFHEWPGFFHEMFNEPERQQVFEKMDGWIQELLA